MDESAAGVSHTVSIVLFSRYYNGDLATPSGAQSRGLMRDLAGRYYTDYYKMVTENESRADWQVVPSYTYPSTASPFIPTHHLWPNRRLSS